MVLCRALRLPLQINRHYAPSNRFSTTCFYNLQCLAPQDNIHSYLLLWMATLRVTYKCTSFACHDVKPWGVHSIHSFYWPQPYGNQRMEYTTESPTGQTEEIKNNTGYIKIWALLFFFIFFGECSRIYGSLLYVALESFELVTVTSLKAA